MPLLQCTIISRFLSSSAKRCGNAGNGQQRAAGDLADLIFLGIAHIEDDNLVAFLQAALQLFDGDVAADSSAAGGKLSWPRMPQN